MKKIIALTIGVMLYLNGCSVITIVNDNSFIQNKNPRII